VFARNFQLWPPKASEGRSNGAVGFGGPNGGFGGDALGKFCFFEACKALE